MNSALNRFKEKERTVSKALGPGSYDNTKSIFDLAKIPKGIPKKTGVSPAFGSNQLRFALGKGY